MTFTDGLTVAGKNGKADGTAFGMLFGAVVGSGNSLPVDGDAVGRSVGELVGANVL